MNLVAELSWDWVIHAPDPGNTAPLGLDTHVFLCDAGATGENQGLVALIGRAGLDIWANAVLHVGHCRPCGTAFPQHCF